MFMIFLYIQLMRLLLVIHLGVIILSTLLLFIFVFNSLLSKLNVEHFSIFNSLSNSLLLFLFDINKDGIFLP